jgi:hypothetical protein
MNTNGTLSADRQSINGKPILTQRETRHLTRLTDCIIDLLSSPTCTGFTLDPLTFQGLPTYDVAVRSDVYVVSVQAHEFVFRTTPTWDDIQDWVEGAYEVLCLGGHYVGAWKHQGAYYLDVSRVIVGLRRAMTFARSQQQHSIYHPDSGESIAVDFLDEDDDDCSASVGSPVLFPMSHDSLATSGA